MYSAISVVLVLCILDCKGDKKEEVASCYYDNCNTNNNISNISCGQNKKIMITSLEIKQIAVDECVDGEKQDTCCGNGSDYRALNGPPVNILVKHAYYSCSGKNNCSFLQIGQELLETIHNLSLCVNMEYSCVKPSFKDIHTCGNKKKLTQLENEKYYNLKASRNTQCTCTIENEERIMLTIVGRTTGLTTGVNVTCAVLTVNDLMWDCSNQTFDRQHVVLAAGATYIQLHTIQSDQTPWIIINPKSDDGNVNVTCGPVVATVTTTADASTTEVTVTSSVDYSDSTTTTTIPHHSPSTSTPTVVSPNPITPPHSPSTDTPTVTDHPQSPTPASTSPTQTRTDSVAGTHKRSSIDTDDDSGFPVAAAVSVPLALVAVAAVIVAIIICRRFKQKSKGDPDIYEGSNNKDPTVNQLDNPTYNEHEIDANQASIDVYNTIDTVDTKYTECGDIDDSNDYLKPLDQRHKLSNGAGSRQQNGDPYDHLYTPGERVQTDGNYDHLDTKAPCNDVTYSHTDGSNGNSNEPLNDNTTAEDDTYNHLDNGVANAPAREHFKRTEEGNVSTMDVNKDKPKNQGEGNLYNELRPEDEKVQEAATADRMPPHYEGLETAGDFASADVYTDLRGVDENAPSPYQTLTSQHGQMNDKPNRSESPVMVDDYFTIHSDAALTNDPESGSAAHDYFTLKSDAALIDDPERNCTGHDYFTLKSDAALIDDPENNSAGHDYFTLKSDAALIDDPERNSAGHDYFTLKSDAAPIDDPDRSSACHDYFTLNSK